MPETVLHLGGHRTGTTSLQKYLKANQKFLDSQGIHLIFPPKSRDVPVSQLRPEGNRCLISDENILGTMEFNIERTSLYPTIGTQLGRCKQLLNNVDTVFLSIREIGEWWSSAISFCLSRDTPLPSDAVLKRIAESKRGWTEVVSDIKRCVPDARVVVREFRWKQDNPKQQLRQLTKWPEWNGTDGIKDQHNKQPSIDVIAMAMARRFDFSSLARLPEDKIYQPFTKPQLQAMQARYRDDLTALSRDTEIDFWVDPKPKPKRSTTPKVGIEQSAEVGKPTICFLHIGKTGGTFIKSIAEEIGESSESLYLGQHSDTLVSTIRDFGRHRKLAFFFRKPQERFVSGFLSRLRQGRPTYNAIWTAGEAAAFGFFSTPNELAEALSSKDERKKSAAHFAFHQIFHLKHDYGHYLHSPEAISYEHEMRNIEVCCETRDIDQNLNRILSSLGLSVGSSPIGDKNSAPAPIQPTLSPLGQRNLENYWKLEFQIYDACQQVSKDLSFLVKDDVR